MVKLTFKDRLRKVKHAYKYFMRVFISKKELGYCGQNSILEPPVWIESPQNVYLANCACIRHNCQIINSPAEKVIIKSYSVLAADVKIITNSHRSTVGIPQFILGAMHINDKSADVIIDEDVWVGAGATILPGVHLGRGCIVAAGAIVSKSVPPYALVAGIPARIIAKIFSIEDVLEHEKQLYKEKDRISKEELRKIYDAYFLEKKVYGVSGVMDEETQKRVAERKTQRHIEAQEIPNI